MSTPARKPALTKAPAREHPVAPAPEVHQPVHPPETVMLSARVDVEFRQAVKRHALEHGMSVQQVVAEALRAYLDGPDRPADMSTCVQVDV